MSDDYAQWRRAIYQALTAAKAYDGLGSTLGRDMSANRDRCLELFRDLLAHAPEDVYQDVLRNLKRRDRILGNSRNSLGK